MVTIDKKNLPEDLYYHKEHAWARIEGDDIIRVGMHYYYQESAGETTYVDLPFEGDDVEQGETCGKIQSAKWVGKFVTPISGEILQVNEELEDEPTLINTSPYDKGWIMMVKPSNLDEDLKNLLQGVDQVVPFVKKSLEEAAKKKG
jgi:glycine cleavage system H protein